jgi:TolA-binding protein
VGKVQVKFLRPITAAAACAAIALVPASVLAQRPPPTPEQRIERLERQIQQMQRQVFPRGAPAATAGFSDEPAATQSSVATLDQRLNSLERQMADILRQSEENGHRLQTLERDLARARTSQEERFSAIERRLNEAAAAAAAAPAVAPPVAAQPPAARPAAPATTRPTTTAPRPTPGAATPRPAGEPATNSAASAGPAGTTPVTDPGEEAYTAGFRLWEAGQYDEAISSLRAFTAAYPRHRRVSFANNLIGRALLDKGDARAAAEALLANYRTNPRGERAPDSLYYLGQALMQLGQPAQACNAYQELNAVYGSRLRADLKPMVQEAQARAQCR